MNAIRLQTLPGEGPSPRQKGQMNWRESPAGVGDNGRAVDLSGLRILLAADNRIVRDGFHEACRQWGAEDIHLAASCMAVVTALNQGGFGLIIAFAEMEGFFVGQLIKEMRLNRYAQHPFAAVVMLTGAPDRQLIERVLHCGPDDILAMPASPLQLAARLKAVAQDQRGFVVAENFAGPMRLAAKIFPPPIPTLVLDIPNPLARSRARADGDLAEAVYSRTRLRLEKRLNRP